MSTVGQIEKATQARVVALLQLQLGYNYLGNWIDQDNANIDTARKTTGLVRVKPEPTSTEDPRIRILAQQVCKILDMFPSIVADPRVQAMARRAPAGNGSSNHTSDGRQVELGVGA